MSITSEYVVSVAGILLPIFDTTQVGTGNLVLVPSTLTNLRSLALAVAAGRAVCLEGPVGCGKTALVEYLAIVTGRSKSPNFIKVQLGDQTDSKMLLGTYRCTDVPGEFIWQPGVLTQALIGGSWILLEDIDSAPTDVITILASLLETGSISVPGYRDCVTASPGFQLFTTQRLIQGNIGGMHKQQVGGINPMENLWVKVCMEPLSHQELSHVVKAMYPVLRTIATRIMDAFILFSAGRHHTSLQSDNVRKETGSESGSKENYCEKSVQPRLLGGRLTSTRDLIKWCSRIVTGYDVSSQESSLNVLANAVDVFCCSTSDPSCRMDLAANIAACLGIIRTKAEYICQTNKPTVSSTPEYLCVGRAKMMRAVNPDTPAYMNISDISEGSFSLTRQTCQLLERVGVCVTRGEAVLLVGETGTGKTSIIQFLSKQLHTHLVVLNMNQQSDSADLLGGYKPVDMKVIVAPLKDRFEAMFVKTFSRKQNIKFLEHISTCFQNRNWKTLLKLMKHSSQAGVKRICGGDKEKGNTTVTKAEWFDLLEQIDKLELQLKNSALVFSFIEGSLVKALREGWWVLLDEINLATGETLECLSGLLEGNGDVGRGSLCLHERGDTTPIVRHPNFRLFACMNPATDIGKKDLPPGLRNRFTEFYVDELTEKSDLIMLAGNYLSTYSVPPSVLESIISFYLKVRKEAALSLCDGIGHKPHYSLRTLCRALSIAARNPCGAYIRSLYESFSLGFLTQLDRKSHPVVEAMISKALFKSENKLSVIRKPLTEPIPHGSHVCIEGYWICKGSLEPQSPKRYIITPSVQQNLKDLARVVSLSKGTQPCLLQGETSVGKTSLIEFLAASTGNVVLRVNNHEHTDLQEYVGAYTADAETGKMVFAEGVLVEAMRKGYWIILDELNLAPSDVLEALNRVLDDNRELYITETQEVVQAHPHFMLFATQNPPGHYGGRKMLSRAFRNRFVELHFDEIPPEELRTILEMRCDMPPSYAKKLVAVMTDLQVYRRGSAMFAGKHGFITLRDLFRWGERYRLGQSPEGQSAFYDWDLHLAHEGYLLLAGRVRKEEERIVIANTIKKRLNRAVDPEVLFTLNSETSPVTRGVLEELLHTHPPKEFRHLVWTHNMRRQAVLVAKAFQFHEPVLLIGETGIGKTTVCQLLAKHRGQILRSVNCHMHTEGADFLGGLRPVRDKKPVNDSTTRLFEWVDGPLVKAMQKGDIFLADEISLADDSVLERLNSLLEPERKLLLAEKGGGENGAKAVVLKAHEKFHFVGTMNPGGDFGKKELSPALRNRFTEIWCEGCKDRSDLMNLIEENIGFGLSLANQEDATSGIGHIILDFMDWFSSTDIGKRFTISFRDYLNWINFINLTINKASSETDERNTPPTSVLKLNLPDAIVHGACITFLDSLGSGISSTEKESSVHTFHETAVRQLVTLVQRSSGVKLDADAFLSKKSLNFQDLPSKFGCEPFFIPAGGELLNHDNKTLQYFAFGAPTSGRNALRICRALQIPGRPILLEGSPGVGKTALVSALATKANHRLVRINLSEQTDVSDLFGADLPVEGGEGGQFSWKDGPFLQALKAGSWILLDELNLASQSVLEGLNAVLDHRGEVFIPELGRTFSIQKDTTCIFACQNPLNQGGARRGLPRSFLNRFTQVFIDPLTSGDYEFILSSAFPHAPRDIISRAVRFNSCLVQEVQVQRLWGQRGAPWEFNLRDLIRWFEAMARHHDNSKKYGSGPEWDPGKFIGLLYVDRMRTPCDQEKVKCLYDEVFSGSIYKPPSWGPPRIRVDQDNILFGDVFLMRFDAEPLTSPLAHNAHPYPDQLLLHRCSNALRSLALCVQMKWLPILVGSIGSGKTSLVKLLAHLTGRELRIMPVNSSMDTTEILGGFEQTDYNRQFDLIAEKTERLVMHCLRKHLLSSTNQHATMDVKYPVTANLLHHWEEFQRLTTHSPDFITEKCREKEVLENKIVSLLTAVEATVIKYGKRLASRAKSLAQDVSALLSIVQQDNEVITPQYKERYAALAKSWHRLIKTHDDNLDELEGSRNLVSLWGCQPQNPEDNEDHQISPVKQLLKRLKALEEVLMVLEYHLIYEVSKESRSLMVELKKLESCIIGSSGKLTSSGTFEWVDSILVKCLKDGCWLLVENVNLCSSAVLDRLNGLLEPNGTLSIGERGVMQNEVPTITPHPDFRMFFTLDPRHGQISRAMRNRGVEIFLTSPDEGIDYDNVDKRALLSEAGVKSLSLQSKILGIHEVMSSTIMGPEKPCTIQLLHLAFLLAQQLSHSSGAFSSMLDSLRSAACDVYVRSQKSSFETKKVAMATLNEALCVVSNSGSLQSDVKDYFEKSVQEYREKACSEVPEWHVTLHYSDLEMNTFGAVAWQRSVLLNVLLFSISPENAVFSFPGGFTPCRTFERKEPVIKLPSTNFWRSGLPEGSLSPYKLPGLKLIPCLVLAYYASASADEANSRHEHLLYICRNLGSNIKSFVKVLSEKISKLVMSFPTRSNKPWDTRWWNTREVVDGTINAWTLLMELEVHRVIENRASDGSPWFDEEGEIKTCCLILKEYSKNMENVVVGLEKAICYDSYNANMLRSNLYLLLTPGGKMCHLKLISAYDQLGLQKTTEAVEVTEAIKENFKLLGFSQTPDGWVALDRSKTSYNEIIKMAVPMEAQVWPVTEFYLLSMNSLLKRLLLSINGDLFHFQRSILPFRHDSDDAIEEVVALNEMGKFVDVNYLLSVASSLYLALNSSLSAPPKVVASTKMICNDLATILNGGCLAVKDWLFHVHDFLVCSAVKEEYSVLLTNPQMWSSLDVNPVQLEDDNYLNLQSCDEKEGSLHLHCPVLSATLISFVMKKDDLGKDVLRTVPLQLHIKRKEQLKAVFKMLWKNQRTFCSEDFDYRMNDAKSVVSSVSALLEVAKISLETRLSTNDKWESMLSLFLQSLEEKNCLLIESLKAYREGSEDERTLVFLTGACWCLYGGLCILLTTASGLFDPSLKRDIKIHYYTQELEEIQLTLYTHEMHSKLEVGLKLADLSSYSALHPNLLWLKSRELFLKKKLKSLSERIAARPSPSKFYELAKALYNFVTRIGSPETVNNLDRKLTDAIKSLQDVKKEASFASIVSNARKTLDEAVSWRTSLSQFSQQLLQQFGSWYNEMINPVVGGIHQMLHGISLQSSMLKKTLLLNKNRAISALISSQHTYLDHFMCKLVCFPSVGPRQTLSGLASLCASKSTLNLLEAVFDTSDFTPNEKDQLLKKMALRLTMAGLEEVKNEIAVQKTISNKLNSWDVLMNVLWKIAKSWEKDLEISRQRKAEEESLYTTRCSTRPGVDDDNIDPVALSLEFPDYRTDFEDLESVSLNADFHDPTKHREEDNIFKKDDFILFDKHDMNHVVEIHSTLLTSLTKANWLSSKTSDAELMEKINYLEPLLERYGVFSHLLNHLSPALSSDMDRSLCQSLTVLTSIAIQESKDPIGDQVEIMKTTHSKTKKKSSSLTNVKENPDFYHDPWIQESVRCLPVLNDLKGEIQRLLLSWPEHPVLCQISTVVDRILSFPTSSPLSRFVTGLELTLAKAQEWESNAHSGISLCDNLSQLTSLIIDWRKLELNSWKDCLNNSARKVQTEASKWWFHLFWLVHAYVKPEIYGSSQPQEGTLKATESGELLSLLKQFLEDSPIGEFNVRLNLLYVFHCHSVNMEPSERQGELQKMFWNVYKFYSQFQVQVGSYLQKLRNPIEKKLKEYVKIARWNDISYWSVKETISKAHRTLHKYVKEFEKVLQLPVSSALMNTKEKIDEDKGKEPEKGQGSGPGRKENCNEASFEDSANYLSELKVEAVIQPSNVDPNLLIHQAAHYSNRSRRLCNDIISSFKYSDLIEAINSLTGEVIESAAHLGSLQVPVGLPKEKHKSAAKNILQRKRRALADLFRLLTQLGLSYRTGLVLAEKHGNMRESISSSLDMFLIPPIDLKAAFNQLKWRKADEQLIKKWNGCEAYFSRSMAQLAQLNMVLSISPSKDLGPPSIERFRGFTSHLMHMIKWQKELLASSSDHLVTFRKQLSHLSSLEKGGSDEISAPSQDKMKDNIVCISSVISTSIICLQQLWLYLQSCPESSDLDNGGNVVAILPAAAGRTSDASSYQDLSGMIKGDERWKSITDDVQVLIKTIIQLQSNLDAVIISSSLPITPSQWTVFVEAAHELQRLASVIEKLIPHIFTDLSSSLDLPCAFESFKWIVNEMNSVSTRIICASSKSTVENSSDPVITDSLVKKVSQFEEYSESLLKKVLLIFQAFYKKWYAKDLLKDPKCDSGATTMVAEVQCNSVEIQENTDKATEEEEMAKKDDILESHLSKKINESLSSDVELLQLGDVTSTVEQLISQLAYLMDENSSSMQSQHCKRVLLSCLPVLDQLSLLSQYVVTQLTISHRASAKLLSVLLDIFSDIAARGFCTPKGLEEDGDGDGGGKGDGKWEEKEGLGLGDMEDGDEKAKESSSKLESEDQLEGAHQEGKEKEEKADKDMKEEETGVEMSDDFEGKLQDLGEKEGEGDESGEDEDDGNADKQMGETGGEGERLDDQIWGSDSEEEDMEEKENDKEGGGTTTGEQPELAAKDERAGKAEDDDERDNGKEKKQKDINEMEDKGEIDDDQVDPYHGKQDAFPEPEAMDLPDDLQLDDGEAKDKDGDGEENPFDIDTMKEQIKEGLNDANEENTEEDAPPNDQPEGKGEDVEEEDDMAGEGLRQEKMDVEEEKDEGGEDEGEAMEERGTEGGQKEGEEDDEEMREEEEVAAPSDDQPSAEPVEALDQVAQDGSKDKTKSVMEHSNEDEGKNADDSKEKHGVGLNQEEQREKGHGGEAEEANLRREKEAMENAEKEERKRRRPGESDSTRTLGETKEPRKKKLKTVDTEGKKGEEERRDEKEDADDKMEEENEGEHEESELYEHIKEAKEKSSELTLDAATKEQTESQPVLNLDENEEDKDDDMDKDIAAQEEEPMVEEEDIPTIEDSVDIVEEKSGERKKKKEAKSNKERERSAEGGAEVEGEMVATQGVARGNETFFHTQLLALDLEQDAKMANPEELRLQLQNQLAEWSQPPAGDEALHMWDNFVALTEGLSRDLSEQLRLVLEPTQASRLKGDYRTGRRINMRKVIPYIASEFRKDKIWLRRTKPSKREYQIVLAIDDSSSMADNQSKELAFESLALISRALTLLEAGQLGVLSFGEVVKVLHPLSEPFSEQSGARLLQHFSFDQKKTLIGNLMDTATSLLSGSKTSCAVGVSVAQLLVIVSDGRGVWNEGSDRVKHAVRRAQDSGIFTVFVIVDNPESMDSIMDIRMPIFKGGKVLGITSYLDSFPFPFYLILRDINALPGVLSDALRQWFELVTEMDKH
ncbi:midasin [Hetaerina americana]|uniref:midasin n=1 Tax=Hetaerina americana TaxID=62018 RepID=UPI003A7F154C